MFVGIENSNEFYSQHYLAAILQNDLKTQVWQAWSQDEDNENHPGVALRKIAPDYFKLRDTLTTTHDFAKRLQSHRAFYDTFLYALGYEPGSRAFLLNDAAAPVQAGISRQGTTEPAVWCIPVLSPNPGEFEDPLNLTFRREQFPDDVLAELKDTFFERSVEDVLSKNIFSADAPPRFVLLLGEAQVLLIDRAKWAEKRLLRFDLAEILGRKDNDTLKAFAALCQRNSTAHESGTSVLDALDESSHKHAHGVSKDLKYALREAIELLGNEAVYALKQKHSRVFDRDLAERLSLECLRYMYRLLFLFYIEARPELGFAPMRSATYLKGYSVESLRDLELVRLHTPEARDGFYIHETLHLLFKMVFQGSDAKQTLLNATLAESTHGTFTISPLKSHLFDPERTPLLDKLKFRNEVMQRIVKLMSLSQAQSRRDRTGRISYAQLGINQLGAVYEALLSYRGFFAEEELYEVATDQASWDPLETAYFVTRAELDRYDESERVLEKSTDPNVRPDYIRHPAGKFIYRLAGRDREKSASYYTPESLTRCLVKYALKELLEDEHGNPKKSPAEILDVKICEPAMGSAAFLNEAVNQLSEAYLKAVTRANPDLSLSHDAYTYEKQRVKTYIADNNVFGVDLNPVAVELAEVSLWLNTIHEAKDGQNFVPWFGMQLACGNSLVGARRQVYDAACFGKKQSWLGTAPTRLAHDQARPQGAIYHYLLPDPAMAVYKDKVVSKDIAPDGVKAIDVWRKDFCKDLSATDITNLQELSATIDRLHARHVAMLKDIRRRTTDRLDYFGKPETTASTSVWSSTQDKDRIWHGELFSENVRASSPYRRLKLVMDYWCALWFWPIDQAEQLPDREDFLYDLSLLLSTDLALASADQANLFAATMNQRDAEQLAREFGTVNVNKLIEINPRLAIVDKLSQRYRFFHWELEFADIFAERGGFDLILGNPPWLKVEWNESAVLGDVDPFFVLKKISASETAKLRAETLEKLPPLRARYLAEYEEAEATKNFLNATQNYAELKGIQTNLYKCFLPLAWRIGQQQGVSGFLHPEGIYDDPRGGVFREQLFARLRFHFQFANERGLFAEVHHALTYSVNVFGSVSSPKIAHIANLFTTTTVDDSFEHHGLGPVPGIKDDNNKWNTEGHRDRIIHVTADELALFAQLYDDEGTPALHARLPAIHSVQLLEVLKKFAAQPRRLGDLTGEYFSTEMWHETNAQRDETIKRETRFPKDASEWILSGPHFFVGNPLYKTPRAECTNNSHYDVIDLTYIPDDYLPRTNYVPACSPAEYAARTPRVLWGDQRPVTDFYRLVFRAMLPPANERTLIGAVFAPGSSHIHGVQSTVFQSLEILLSTAALTLTIPADYYIRSTGRTNLHAIWNQLPVFDPKHTEMIRALALFAVASQYRELYELIVKPTWNDFRWALQDPRLEDRVVQPKWTREFGLRTEFERRACLVELDVLVSIRLGMRIEDLITVYRTQFSVMREYERDTWYDQKGRIVFTNSRGLTGVGLLRKSKDEPCWEDVKDMQSGTVDQVVIDDTLPGGPHQRTITYHAPFTRCDREEDYRTAWAEFTKREREAIS